MGATPAHALFGASASVYDARIHDLDHDGLNDIIVNFTKSNATAVPSRSG